MQRNFPNSMILRNTSKHRDVAHVALSRPASFERAVARIDQLRPLGNSLDGGGWPFAVRQLLASSVTKRIPGFSLSAIDQRRAKFLSGM